MSEYLETVIKGTGGHAAPAEILDDEFFEFDADDIAFLEEVGEEYVEFSDDEEDEDRPPAPPGYHYMPDGTLMRDDEHSIQATAGSKPAAPSERIKGSNKNKKGSAATGKGVTFSAKVIKALENKVEKHNEKHGDTASKKTSLRTLKAVYRRGAGAFSTSHRPDQNRNSWAMARVNAFLHLLRTGSPKNKKYVTDNDLLPAAHRRSSKKSAAITAAAGPCWEGYKQVGMKKGKDGEMVPNCVPVKAAASLEAVQSVLTSDEIEEVLSYYNSEVGAARQVALSAAATVCERSYNAYYETCATAELSNAILWELHSFLEYATYGVTEDMTTAKEHDDLLIEGHPSQGMTASVEARINWVAAAPELDESSREAVRIALSDGASPLEAIHASARIKALVASGAMSMATLDYVNGLMTN